MKSIVISLLIGGVLTASILSLDTLGDSSLTNIKTWIVGPFYILGCVVSRNPHAPNEIVAYGMMLLTLSAFTYVAFSILRPRKRK